MLFVYGCLKGTTGVLGVMFFIVVEMMGMYHNLFLWLWYHVITSWTCLNTWSSYFMNRARQLL